MKITYIIFSLTSVAVLMSFSLPAIWAQPADQSNLVITIELGHTAQVKGQRYIEIEGLNGGTVISKISSTETESDDEPGNNALFYCGAGDVDVLNATVSWIKPSAPLRPVGKEGIHMWEYFFAHGNAGQTDRILHGSWRKPDAPVVTIKFNSEGTEGFSVALGQLIEHGAMWLPEHDVFIKVKPVKFEDHIDALKGKRILQKIQEEPDASLRQFREVWTDFGNPLVDDPSWQDWQTQWMGTTGHILVTAPAHGSIYKVAIDRWGNARPDFASPHKFRLDMNWKNSQWTGQSIENGLPLVVTSRSRNGQQCITEQFICPLDPPEAAVQGYIPGALITSIRFSGKSDSIDFPVEFNNEDPGNELELLKKDQNLWIVKDKKEGNIWLMIKTTNALTVSLKDNQNLQNGHQLNMHITGILKPDNKAECILWLASPPVAASQSYRLERLNYKAARDYVTEYWENWLNRGARFEVPEEEVNELFRANLWHALVLPRHTIGNDNRPHMDIPYANTAYGQKNADWPINQAVYVDYMIYGLRGYEKVAEDELQAMFKSQQWDNGRIGGYANWGVYSPGQLYAVAQNYLLSRNRESFERLLPSSLKTLDWCLAQMAAADSAGYAGLINAPLNDNSPEEHVWAFTQAYFVGGLNLFAKALAVYGHPAADEVKEVAVKMQQQVLDAFSRASVLSPVVQLEDGTWINYVPTDASTPRRQVNQWYPTDVDTGPLHLSRLEALPSYHWLTTSMLHDHEDNLFLCNRGAANEPVYLPQANVYLLRDDPKAVIRSFYSMMASAFSHNQLTSLEHRWAHPVYYGPPSTDGAWFEIYRKMLIHETGEDTLFIGQAIPRAWLGEDKKIEVQDAPTYFGPLSFTVEGLNSSGDILAEIDIADRNPPGVLKVRFRHPKTLPIKSLLVNGQKWDNYDASNETITIVNPQAGKITVKASY